MAIGGGRGSLPGWREEELSERAGVVEEKRGRDVFSGTVRRAAEVFLFLSVVDERLSDLSQRQRSARSRRAGG